MEHRLAVRPPADARRLLVSFAPHAGARSLARSAQQIGGMLAAAGYLTEITSDLVELSELAGRHHQAGALRAVLACGGDGTAAAVRGRVPLEVPLLVVPMGTENLLGKYISQSPAPAAVARTLDEGVSIDLDLGVARGPASDERCFLMMFSAGFDAEIVRRLHQRRRGHITHLSYLQPTLHTIRSYQYPLLTLYCHDTTRQVAVPIRCRWALGFNLPLYARGWCAAPEAAGTDGLLDVCTFDRGSLPDGLRYLWHVIRGTHLQLADVRLIRCRAVRIEAPDAAQVAYQLDGDYGGTLPVDVELMPEKLRLMVMPNVAERLGFLLPTPL